MAVRGFRGENGGTESTTFVTKGLHVLGLDYTSEASFEVQARAICLQEQLAGRRAGLKTQCRVTYSNMPRRSPQAGN